MAHKQQINSLEVYQQYYNIGDDNMARNEKQTIQFVAKMLWKYRGAVKRAEIVERLLECDCIRRNYSKGTILNLVQQFRAWLQDPECKLAKRIPKAYIVYLNKYREEDVIFKEDIKPDTDTDNDTKEVDKPKELPLTEQYLLVEKEQKELKEALDRYLEQLEKQEAELDKQYDDINNKKHAASAMYYDKNKEYEIVLDTIRKQIIWQEMMK